MRRMNLIGCLCLVTIYVFYNISCHIAKVLACSRCPNDRFLAVLLHCDSIPWAYGNYTPAWHTGMTHRHDTPAWHTGMTHRHDTPTWHTGMAHWHDTPAWHTGMTHRHTLYRHGANLSLNFSIVFTTTPEATTTHLKVWVLTVDN